MCNDAAYDELRASLGGVRHLCPNCGSAEHGRPLIERGHLSVTHVADHEVQHVVAVADRPVGVDAEPFGAGQGIDAVALHPRERDLFASLPEAAHQPAVLEVWVAKEAALKLHGSGLQIAPETFVARRDDGWGIAAGTVRREPIFLTVQPIAALVIAIATDEPVTDLRVHRRTASRN